MYRVMMNAHIATHRHTARTRSHKKYTFCTLLVPTEVRERRIIGESQAREGEHSWETQGWRYPIQSVKWDDMWNTFSWTPRRVDTRFKMGQWTF